MRLDFAKLIENVVSLQIFQEHFVFGALDFSQIAVVHAIIYTQIIRTCDIRSLINLQSTINMRKIKAGKRGQVVKYISRAKAIRKLQVSLKDFRKLCILKGVYPREPPKKLKKTSRSYYHLKDINFMALDPLIQKIRAQKVYMRKYKKAKAKGDIGTIRYLVKHKPTLNLSHLIRERYPQFIDALRDLDDPLSLMALFTIFPSHKEFNLTGDKVQLCSKLLKHFELYVIRSHALRKVFVSIKGIYYQCEILGQLITYIVPFKYPASLPIDVDYRVMVTFLDFYLTLLKFVNFKLYSSLNLQYPPIQHENTSYQGYELLKIQSNQKEDQRYKIDEEFKQKQLGNTNLLFANLKFYLSSEVPKYSLQYVILAFGGQVLQENDHTVTHVITDRDNVKKEKTKEYVQPQWIYDSVNFQRLLNVKQYDVGKTLPPHLSPFINQNDQQRYIPERQKELKGLAQDKPEAQPLKQEGEENYDIIAESKKKLANKLKEQKEFSQISKNVMSNKNRKLLKAMEKGIGDKRKAAQKLKEKSTQLKK